MAGISEFLGTVQKIGLAKDSYFEVTVFSNDGSDTRLFSLLCHQASIPGYKINSHRAKIYGLPYQVPTGIEYDPFYCSFYVDNAFTIPAFLYKHRDEKLVSQINYSPKYRDSSALMTIVLTVFDSGNNNPVAAYVMADAYFDTVQSAPVSWSSHNALINMTANIAYERLYEVVMDFSSETNAGGKAAAPANYDAANQSSTTGSKDATKQSEGGGVVGFIRNAKKDLTGVIRTATAVRNTVTDVVSNIVNPIREYTSLATTTIGAVRDAAGSIVAAPNQVLGEIGGIKNDITGTINSSRNTLNNLGGGFF